MFKKPRLITLIIIVVYIGIIVSLSRSVYSVLRAKQRVANRHAALEEARQRNDNLSRRLAIVETTAYIEQQARNRLNLVREGEQVVILPGDSGRERSEGEDDPTSLPNWQQWWEVFF